MLSSAAGVPLDPKTVNSYENSLGERERVLENSLRETQQTLQAEAQERERLAATRRADTAVVADCKMCLRGCTKHSSLFLWYDARDPN